MKTRVIASIALISAATAFAGPKMDLTNFHAKTSMSVSGGRQGQMAFEGEVWIKTDKLRMEMTTPMGPSTTVVDGKNFYVWQERTKQGMKSALTAEQRGSSLIQVASCLEAAEARGGDTIDGVATEKFHYTGCGGAPGSETTVWMAKGTTYPVRLENKNGAAVTTINYKDVEIDKPIAADKFVPPTDVQFRDLAEAMRQMQSQGPPPTK